MALRASIGQYLSVDSPVHRLDPRIKLVGTPRLYGELLFVHTPLTLLLAAGAIGAAIACAHVPLRRLLVQIRPIALFLVITSLVNLLFVQTGAIALSAGPLRLYWGRHRGGGAVHGALFPAAPRRLPAHAHHDARRALRCHGAPALTA